MLAHVAFRGLLEFGEKKQALTCITDPYDDRYPPDNARNAKSAENVLMISPEPFLSDITNPSKCGYCASISWG